MPREREKRGRRAQAQKRKLDELDDELYQSKRQRTLDGFGDEFDYLPFTDDSYGLSGAADNAFFGGLELKEQEYFRHADDLLEANGFPSADERNLFLANVFTEAHGKAVKLATSPPCSRLLEKLINLSSADQLVQLYNEFGNDFGTLSQHQYASHCCEALLVKAASIFNQEILLSGSSVETISPDETEKSIQGCVTAVAGQLSSVAIVLITHPYGSHVLRVLLLVLSGQPLEGTSSRSLLRSKRSEQNEVTRQSEQSEQSEALKTQRQVPASFTDTMEALLQACFKDIDDTSIQELAMHPTANPLLQLLIRLEFNQYGKQHLKEEGSILRKIIPESAFTTGSDGASFVNRLLYDSIGSHLMEMIVECAPASIFKQLFKEVFRERVVELAQHDTASYVLGKVMERVGKDDLKHIHDSLLPHLPALAQRGRVHLVKILVERCAERGLSTKELAQTITLCWPDKAGESLSLAKMLGLESTTRSGTPTAANNAASWQSKASPVQTHTSLVAQAMLKVSGPLADLVFNALSSLPSPACLLLAYSPTFSPILQVSLTVRHAPVIFRRKVITRFYSHAFALSTDASGSHLVDAIWHGTSGMAFVRERIAEELAENETSLRENHFGRKIWKNWKMDMYRRKRSQWVAMVRTEVGNDGFQSFPDSTDASQAGRADNSENRTAGSPSDAPVLPSQASTSAAKGKTNLDIARERFVKSQAQKQAQKQAGPAQSGVTSQQGQIH